MKQYRLNFNGHLVNFSSLHPLLMGILNVTPDSFFNGGKYDKKRDAIQKGLQMEEEGADIIDVGGESTRPGAQPVSEEEEKRRILPVIEKLSRRVGIPISVDTYKAGVARSALEAGASMVNDISAMRFDPEMVHVLRDSKVPVCLMHMQGEPRNMQENPSYENVVEDVCCFLRERVDFAQRNGIKKERVVVDPGIGFGKRLMDNYEIIRRLGELSSLGCPILIGPSRKSFIGKILDLPPAERLEGTVAAVAMSIQNGAHIVRVHDVKEIRRACRIADLLAGKKASVEES